MIIDIGKQIFISVAEENESMKDRIATLESDLQDQTQRNGDLEDDLAKARTAWKSATEDGLQALAQLEKAREEKVYRCERTRPWPCYWRGSRPYKNARGWFECPICRGRVQEVTR